MHHSSIGAVAPNVHAAAVAVICTALLCVAQNPVELVDDLCPSTTGRQQVRRLSIRTRPLERPVLYTFPGEPNKIEIDCLQLVDIGVVTDVLCEARSLVWLCWAPELGEEEWECTPLTQYRYSARGHNTWGSVNGPRRRWRLEYDGSAKPAFCFPRDTRLSFIGGPTDPVGGSVALMVIFGLVLLGLFITILVFGGYQFRKTLAKLFRTTRFGAAYTERQMRKGRMSELELLDVPFVQPLPVDVPPIATSEAELQGRTKGRSLVSAASAYFRGEGSVWGGGPQYTGDGSEGGNGADKDGGDVQGSTAPRPHELSLSKDTYHPSPRVELPPVERSLYIASLHSPPRRREVQPADCVFLAATAQHAVIPPSVHARMLPERQHHPDGSSLLSPRRHSPPPTRLGSNGRSSWR